MGWEEHRDLWTEPEISGQCSLIRKKSASGYDIHKKQLLHFRNLLAKPSELSMTIDKERLQRSQERERELKAMMVAALDGDEQAYRRCLLGLSKHLRAFLARRLSRDAAEVEDLVQETLLAIHCQRHTFATDRPLTAWVQAIASYKLADWFRGYGGRIGQMDPLHDHEDFFADDIGLAGEATRDVRQLLKDLPERWRTPIQLTKLDGYSVSEAAQASGMSESAIKVGVHRGMKALAQLVRKQT